MLHNYLNNLSYVSESGKKSSIDEEDDDDQDIPEEEEEEKVDERASLKSVYSVFNS